MASVLGIGIDSDKLLEGHLFQLEIWYIDEQCERFVVPCLCLSHSFCEDQALQAPSEANNPPVRREGRVPHNLGEFRLLTSCPSSPPTFSNNSSFFSYLSPDCCLLYIFCCSGALPQNMKVTPEGACRPSQPGRILILASPASPKSPTVDE